MSSSTTRRTINANGELVDVVVVDGRTSSSHRTSTEPSEVLAQEERSTSIDNNNHNSNRNINQPLSSSLSSSSSSSLWNIFQSTLSTLTSTSSSSNSNMVDFFGFNLTLRQVGITLFVAWIILGSQTTIALLVALGIYTIWSRMVVDVSGSSSSFSSSYNTSRGGRGWTNTNRWNGGGNSNGSGRSNIRGISDLPCDPQRG